MLLSCPELEKPRPNDEGRCLREAPPTAVVTAPCEAVLRPVMGVEFCVCRGRIVFRALSRYCACRITCSLSRSMFHCMVVGGGAWGGVWGAEVGVDVGVRTGVGAEIDTAGVEGGVSCVDTSGLGGAMCITGIDSPGVGAGITRLGTGITGVDTGFEAVTDGGVVNTEKTVCCTGVDIGVV